jgi:alkylhydroperoxidase family enzyme
MQQGLTDELYNLVHTYRTSQEFTVREKLSIEFAERFVTDHVGIDDEFFGRLRTHFNDTEVLELTILIGFCVGIGRAFHVLDIARDFDVLWSRESNGQRPETPKVERAKTGANTSVDTQ